MERLDADWPHFPLLLIVGVSLVRSFRYVKQHRGGWTKPLVIFGTNAIAAYPLAELVSSLLYSIHFHSGRRIITLQDFLYRSAFGSIMPKELGSLAYAVVFVFLSWLPIFWMYRERIFLKV
jgi:predicted acyltransferase